MTVVEGNTTGLGLLLANTTFRVTGLEYANTTVSLLLNEMETYFSVSNASGSGSGWLQKPGVTIIGNTTYILRDAVFLGSPTSIPIALRPFSGNVSDATLTWNVSLVDVSVGGPLSRGLGLARRQISAS